MILNFDIHLFQPQNLIINDISEELEQSIKEDFKEVIKALALSFENRFYLISSSIHKRKKETEEDFNKRKSIIKKQSEIENLFNIYLIPQTIIDKKLNVPELLNNLIFIGEHLTNILKKEIDGLVQLLEQTQIDFNKLKTKCLNKQTIKLCENYSITIPLNIGFIVENFNNFNREFPFMFELYCIFQTIEPTSVNVERGFSKIKTILKPNMSRKSLNDRMKLIEELNNCNS